MKKHLTTLFLFLMLIVGLGLLLYPSFSNYWNSFRQSRVIAHYAEDIMNMDSEVYERILENAAAYNQRLAESQTGPHIMQKEELAEYNSQLNPSRSGMMGYIEIPNINCYLAIYHGTDAAVLQIATGHLEWSSLPVGGESTHTVISGHRGLPSAKLFTDLNKVNIGDIFTLNILGDTYTYSVDQILIVDPSDVEALKIVEGEDYCTLVTCTPYGINTHRLLVRGTRIENIVDRTLHFTSEAMKIDSILVAPVVAAPILLLLMVIVLLGGGKKSRKERSPKSRAQLYDEVMELLAEREKSEEENEFGFIDDRAENKRRKRKK